MPGYTWHPRVRMTPLNGLPETIDLSTVFFVGSSPASALVSIELKYQEIQSDRETVNRMLRPLNEGFRVGVKLNFSLYDMSAQYFIINKIQNRLQDAGLWTVELSLDSSGAIYRVVVLDKAYSPKPFRGKTVAGAAFTLELLVRDPILQLPDINGGTGW